MRDIRYQIAFDRQPDNALTDEAAEIEVQQTIEGPTTFRIKFSIDICQGDFDLLNDARLNPGANDPEITVTAYLNGASEVLAHGIITGRKVNLTEGGAGSSLEITCQDRRIVMNRQPRTVAHDGFASDIVEKILSKADYKLEADVTRTKIEYQEDKVKLNQTESDLAFVDKLAGRNGFRFWLDWKAAEGLTGFELTETAHFKPSPPRPAANGPGFTPPVLLAPPGAAVLKLNTGEGCSNVASFELQTNAEAPNKSASIAGLDPDSGEKVETDAKPSNEPLGAQPAAPDKPREARLVTPGSDIQEGQVRTEAALNDASWSVQATVETSVQSLDAFVAPHQIIRLEGAGKLNSGDYFVKAVTHTIDTTAHKMRIELLRNALGG
ncbi:MAG TPA: hypothetical protein VF240_18615 [Pyrinomonadaceae bacterium]